MSIDKIEYIEKSICSSISKVLIPESINIFNVFKNIENMSLKKELEDIRNRAYYKYTHEAILSGINTHGLFQFYLNKKKNVDIEITYKEYLEDRIVDIFDNLKTDQALVIAVNLFSLISSYLALELNININLKKILSDGLKQIVDAYEFYAGMDSVSILLLDIRKEVLKWI